MAFKEIFLQAHIFRQCVDSIHQGKMEQILFAYVLPRENVTITMMFYKNTKAMVYSSDGDTDDFDIVNGVLQGDRLAPCVFVFCLDYILETSIDLIKENGFTLKKRQEADSILQKV